MSFWDNLGKKVTDAGQITVQKTKEISEVSRISTLISQNEENIRRLYTQIGMKYYDMHKSDSEEDSGDGLGELVRNIVNLENEIENYRNQIQEIKGTQRCEVCGEEVPKGYAFCGKCGAPVRKKQSIRDESPRCPGCGEPVKQGLRFCTRCGYQLFVNDISESLQTAEAETEQDAPSPNVKICPHCKAEMSPDSVFCTVCGNRF